MSDADLTYSLEELARETELPPRTIRYYVQRGVLPPPLFRGPHTGYDRRYVDWLRFISARQAAGWSLDQIALALHDLDPTTGRSRGFRTLTPADLRATPLPLHPARTLQPDPAPAAPARPAPGLIPGDLAATDVNSTVNPPPVVRVQAPAEVWIRMPIAEGIDMWLRHETDAAQRLLQDVVLQAAQTAAAAARKETR